MERVVKFLIVSLFVLLFSAPVFADVLPYYTGSVSKDTIGFLKVSNQFNLYLFPRVDSKVVDSVNWDEYEVSLNNSKMEPSELFTVFIPDENISFCTVIDVQDDWYKIVYDKTNNKSAWIKPPVAEDFWSLRDFYSVFGKRYGLYYMKNIDYRKRGLYSGAYKNSQKLGGFTLIKNIKLNKVSGNWALVTVVDFDSKPKIGYVKWREDDGLIIMFPKFRSQK